MRKIRWMILYQNIFSRDLHTEKYAYLFKEITIAFLALPPLKRKIKQLGLLRRMLCYDIDAKRQKLTEILYGPISNLDTTLFGIIIKLKVQGFPVKLWQIYLKYLIGTMVSYQNVFFD